LAYCGHLTISRMMRAVVNISLSTHSVPKDLAATHFSVRLTAATTRLTRSTAGFPGLATRLASSAAVDVASDRMVIRFLHVARLSSRDVRRFIRKGKLPSRIARGSDRTNFPSANSGISLSRTDFIARSAVNDQPNPN
jgi:hypothetical protein